MTPSAGLPPRLASVASFDDEALARHIHGCAAGRRMDLERLYRLAAPRLLGQLVVLLADRAQAEDALQEVFIKVWERARQFQTGRGRALTWLLAIARHHAIDLLRARRASVTLDEAALAVAMDASSWMSEESDATHALLLRCLAQLTPEQQQCLKLAYAGGHSQDQIAAALPAPLGSVKSWIRRALLSLRECLRV